MESTPTGMNVKNQQNSAPQSIICWKYSREQMIGSFALVTQAEMPKSSSFSRSRSIAWVTLP